MPIERFADIGVLFGAFLALLITAGQLLLAKKDQKNYLFILTIACLGLYQVSLSFPLFGHLEHWQEIYRPLYIAGMGAVYSSIPAMFLFVRSLPDSEYSRKGYRLLHFLIPLIATLVLALFVSFPKDPAVSPCDYYDFLYNGSPLLRIIDQISVLMALGYFSLAFAQFYSLTKKSSDEKKKNLLAVLVVLFLILFFMSLYFRYSNQGDLLHYLFKLRFTLLMICVLVLSYRYPYITNIIKLEVYRESYTKSTLAKVNVDNALMLLEKSMETDHAFRDSTLTMKRIAADLGLSAHQLSEIFNTRLKKTFSSYINEKRVAFAKKLLSEEIGMPVTDIAKECGFNSISNFNTLFKKAAGISPSDYRKSLLSGKKKGL